MHIRSCCFPCLSTRFSGQVLSDYFSTFGTLTDVVATPTRLQGKGEVSAKAGLPTAGDQWVTLE